MIRKRAFFFIAFLFSLFAVCIFYTLLNDEDGGYFDLTLNTANQNKLGKINLSNNVASASTSDFSNSVALGSPIVFQHSGIFSSAKNTDNSVDTEILNSGLYGSETPASSSFSGAIIPTIHAEKDHGIFKEHSSNPKPDWKAGFTPVLEMPLGAPGPPDVVVPLDFGTVYILLAGVFLGFIRSFTRVKNSNPLTLADSQLPVEKYRACKNIY